MIRTLVIAGVILTGMVSSASGSLHVPPIGDQTLCMRRLANVQGMAVPSNKELQLASPGDSLKPISLLQSTSSGWLSSAWIVPWVLFRGADPNGVTALADDYIVLSGPVFELLRPPRLFPTTC